MFIKVAFIVNFMTFFTLSTSTWFITGCNLTYIPLITWKVVFIRESFHSTIFKQFLTERSALKKTKKLWNLHGLILERLVRKKKWQRNKLTCDVSRPCGAEKTNETRSYLTLCLLFLFYAFTKESTKVIYYLWNFSLIIWMLHHE